MKKITKLLIISCILCINTVSATTIKETTEQDEYDTIEPNTFIIGVTKFRGDEVITASKASPAGVNDVITYIENNNIADGYQSPVIYLYLGKDIGWFEIDQNNQGRVIEDEETLNKLKSIDIYYVSNQKKEIN